MLFLSGAAEYRETTKTTEYRTLWALIFLVSQEIILSTYVIILNYDVILKCHLVVYGIMLILTALIHTHFMEGNGFKMK